MKRVVNERNIIFNLLYTMAIIMVIDDHMNTRIGLLSSVFPYNSFYMPLFVFISGYFYKNRGIIDNIKHKTKKLLIPYLIWNVVAIIIAFLLDHILGIDWLKRMSLYDFFHTSFIIGPPTSLNGPSWFVIMLFWVQIVYNIIHSKIKTNKIIDVIFTVFYMALGFASLQLCMKGYNKVSDYALLGLKISFYIQFFHYGQMFKKYIEKRILKSNKIIIGGLCIFINVILLCIYGKKITFIATSNMNSFYYWWLPLITSITGIIFYYLIMEYVSRKIKKSAIVDFISRNTFVILETHLLFVNIPNIYVYLCKINGSMKYSDFNIELFRKTAWLRYNYNTTLIGFFCGLIGSLCVAYFIEKIKERIKTKKNK